VHIPSQRSTKGWCSKVTIGSADDWPALRIAAVLDAVGDKIRNSRIFASATMDKATRLKSAEAVLNGRSINQQLLIEARDAALRDCELIAGVCGSVAYKRKLVRVDLHRTIRAALKQSEAHS
jgi:carbon-monoxide dehydrogenase medium subunit